MADRPLDPRQQRFVSEYLVDLNGTQAAIRAGYSARTANEQASRLLARGNIADAVAAAQAERSRRTAVTADRVLAELARIGFANMADYMSVGEDGVPRLDFAGLSRDQAAAIGELTVEEFLDGRGGDARPVRRVRFKLHQKHPALVDLGRHLGLFRDRTDPIGDITDAELDRVIAALRGEGGTPSAGRG